jgi:hypothetical protein
MWKSEPIKIMGLGAGNRIETDVAALTLRNQLSPTFPMPATSADLVWEQNVYFIGFPYGLHTSVDVNHGYPLPLIKGAVMSGSITPAFREDRLCFSRQANLKIGSSVLWRSSPVP